MLNLNKKNVGLTIILVFVLISALLLLIKQFSISVAMCLVYNCLAIFCILIWSSSVPGSEMRRRVVSAFLWYWLFWYALFSSVKVLIT